MAYVVAKGSSQSILHPVRDLAGTGTVTGQAANLTYTILEPDGTSVTTGLSWSEPNSDGYYLGAQDWDTVGIFNIAVSNASIPSSDLGVYDYQVQVLENVAGVTPSGTYLTTLANLKELLDVNDTSQDALLTNTIARATGYVEAFLGRPLVSASYTELYDGTGTRSLNLRKGPISAVAYVADVAWSGAGVKSTTAISAGDYFSRGTLAEGWKLPGWLERNHSVWWADQQNYEVSYTAGFSSIPYDIEQVVLELCVAYRNQRKDWGHLTREVGSAVFNFRSLASTLETARDQMAPYMVGRWL